MFNIGDRVVINSKMGNNIIPIIGTIVERFAAVKIIITETRSYVIKQYQIMVKCTTMNGIIILTNLMEIMMVFSQEGF